MNDVELTRRAGLVPAAVEEPGDLSFVQVAFAGHNRVEDLGDPALVAAGLEGAFRLLRQAGVGTARLVTGLAPGADVLAANAWKASGLGPIQAVFPFLDDKVEAGAAGLMEVGTWLNGAATEAAGRNPYLAQTRWLIGAADLLIVVWTGEHARGAGGTADAVRLALEHGIPVLWIQTSQPETLQLIRPEHLDDDFGFLEFLEQLALAREPLVRPATAERVREALLDLGLGDPEPAIGDPPSMPTRPWRTFAIFRRLLGGRAPPYAVPPPPADLDAQRGFEGLSLAHAMADRAASAVGSVHRSHQVIMLGVTILVAAAGSVATVWPSVKVLMASIELALAIAALLVWLDSERADRHQRWGEARRLAEDLRLERVAWVLGLSSVPHGASLSSTHAARFVRRSAGLPEGAFTAERIAAWGAWAIEELIAGQAAYHRAQATINGRISHRVHLLENGSFGILLFVLLAFVATSLGMAAFGQHTPGWIRAAVGVAGAMVPAIAAAGLALEATLALGEQAQRSRALAEHLDRIVAGMRPAPALEHFQAAAKAAIRLQRAQEDHWTEGAVRRRLVRGG
jgi:hypothetical protein